MKHRMLQDNVLVSLEPREDAVNGVVIPTFTYKKDGTKDYRDPRKKPTGVRWAKVLAIGPGHREGCKKCGGERGVFIPTTLRPGDRILVDELSGHDYSLDVKGVRQRDRTERFGEVGDFSGELRVIREDEALAIDEDGSCAPTERDPDVGMGVE